MTKELKRLRRKIVVSTNKEYVLNQWLRHETVDSMVDGKLLKWLNERREQDNNDSRSNMVSVL